MVFSVLFIRVIKDKIAQEEENLSVALYLDMFYI